MHIAVQHGVDKINSFQADSLLSEEIDLELNKSIMRFVNLKYGKNNMYGQGFEESQKRIDDLRSLVVSYEELVYFKERRILKFRNSSSFSTNSSFLYVDKFEIPSDYLYHISSYCNSFVSSTCKKDVKFELEQLSGEKILVRIKLDALRVTAPGGASLGWVPTINLTHGATPVAGLDEIDFSDTSTIENIGTSFSMPIWEATNSEDFAGTVQDVTSGGDGGVINWSGTPEVGVSATGYPLGPPGTNYWYVIPSMVGVANHVYESLIPDPSGTYTNQIIDSVITNPIDGVDSYYEQYLELNAPGTFFFVIDTNVFNYVVLQEDANVITQALTDVEYSVNVTTSTVDANTNGYTSANTFSTIAIIQYEVSLSLSGTHHNQYIGTRDPNIPYGYPGGVISDPITTEVSTDVVFSNITDLSAYPGIGEANNLVVDSPVNRLSYPFSYEYLLDAGLKRVLSDESVNPDILNSEYWDGIHSIGMRFAGVSSPIKYIQHDDILTMLKDPFNKPDMDTILGLFDTNSINVYTLIEGTKASPLTDVNYVDVLPYSIKLTYLKKPKQVSLGFNHSSDLPQHTHEEIVAMTVSGILEGISDPRYKSQLNEASKHE